MVLLKDEYTEMENTFLDMYGGEIRHIVYAEKKNYIDEQMKKVNITEFIKKYMGSVIFVFIILYFAWVKDIISLQLILGVVLLVFIMFVPAYYVWKKDMKETAVDAYFYLSQQIVADFIYKKMREVVLNSRIGVDFEKNVQFYSIALYEIPRNFYINVYEDNPK